MRTRSPNFRNGVDRLAVLDQLEHAALGEAGRAAAAVVVRDRARAEDRAGARIARLA